MARNIVVGVDVGTRSIRVVVAEQQKQVPYPVVIGTSIAPSRGLKHGYVLDRHDAAKSIRAAIAMAEKSSRVRIKSVYLSIGGVSLESLTSKGSVTITKADEEVTDLDVQKVVAASKENLKNINNKKIIDTIPLEYKLDGKPILGRPQGLKGAKLEVTTLFIVSLSQHIEDIVRATEAAGVEVEDIAAAPVAASLVALSKRQRTVGSLLVNIGAETVSMSVFEGNVPIALSVFPIGSTDITNDIALGLEIPLEEAEQVKLGAAPHSHPRRQLTEIIEARLSDIFELIEAQLKKIKRNGLLPGGVVITGGGAGIATIEDFAKASLKLPVKIASAEFFHETPHEGHVQDSSWFVAYGLCIFGIHQDRISSQKEFIRGAIRVAKNWIRHILP